MIMETPIAKQIWKYKFFLYNLLVRNLKVSYQGSLLGFLWFVLKPFLFLALYSVAFTYIIRIDVINFPAFLLCGLLPWNYLTSALISGVESVSANADLIKSISFPREILPLTSVLVQLFHFLVSFIAFFPFLLLLGVHIGVGLALVPILVFIQTLFVVGIVLCIATMNVFWRDVRHIVEVLTQVWFWVTPIVYPIDMIPERVQPLIYLNPFTVFVDSYRCLMLKNQLPSSAHILGMLVISLFTLALGTLVFRMWKKRFAEEI